MMTNDLKAIIEKIEEATNAKRAAEEIEEAVNKVLGNYVSPVTLETHEPRDNALIALEGDCCFVENTTLEWIKESIWLEENQISADEFEEVALNLIRIFNEYPETFLMLVNELKHFKEGKRTNYDKRVFLNEAMMFTTRHPSRHRDVPIELVTAFREEVNKLFSRVCCIHPLEATSEKESRLVGAPTSTAYQI
ncbi:hypothetical protein P3547_19785 [Vibrio parahaemolyticus]|nr:hypothetical protein [Vibrio parahaemolyticus]